MPSTVSGRPAVKPFALKSSKRTLASALVRRSVSSKSHALLARHIRVPLRSTSVQSRKPCAVVRASATASHSDQQEQPCPALSGGGAANFFWKLLKFVGNVVQKTLLAGCVLAFALKGLDMVLPSLERAGVDVELYKALGPLIAAMGVALLAFGIVRRNSSQDKLPPGSLGLPFVGETFAQVTAAESFAVSRAATHGDIFKTNTLGQPTIVMSGPENLKFIVGCEKKGLVENDWPSNWKKLMGSEAVTVVTSDKHARQRRILAAAFTARSVTSYYPTVQKEIREACRAWSELGGSFDAYPLVNKTTFQAVGKVLLGPVANDKLLSKLCGLYQEWLKGFTSVLPVELNGLTAFGKAMQARRDIQEALDTVIEERAKCSELELLAADDVLSVMMRTKDEDGSQLTRAELRDNLLTLLFASHDTSTATLMSAAYLLCQHPEVANSIREEVYLRKLANGVAPGDPLPYKHLKSMNKLNSFVDEALRLMPPAGGGMRTLLQDVEYKGYVLPKGWRVNYRIDLTHWDADLWGKDAMDFVPDRDSADNVAFGIGSRKCIGLSLATILMQVFTIELLQHEITLDGPAEFLYFPFHRPDMKLKVVTTDAAAEAAMEAAELATAEVVVNA